MARRIRSRNVSGAMIVIREFDDIGRPIRARATIREAFGGECSGAEASLTGVIGNEGAATDIGGHLIGWRFLGEDSGRFNIVQMNGKLDGGDLPSNLNTGAPGSTVRGRFRLISTARPNRPLAKANPSAASAHGCTARRSG